MATRTEVGTREFVIGARYFALAIGIAYVAIGVLAFVPAFLAAPVGAPDLALTGGYGYFLGIFPVNWVHNIVHLAVGAWGILAYQNYNASRNFERSIAVLFGALAVLGLFPLTRTLFGLTPLFGHDIWLHGLTALVAAYFGFRRAPDADRSRI